MQRVPSQQLAAPATPRACSALQRGWGVTGSSVSSPLCGMHCTGAGVGTRYRVLGTLYRPYLPGTVPVVPAYTRHGIGLRIRVQCVLHCPLSPIPAATRKARPCHKSSPASPADPAAPPAHAVLGATRPPMASWEEASGRPGGVYKHCCSPELITRGIMSCNYDS